jgi:hypothetical protein
MCMYCCCTYWGCAGLCCCCCKPIKGLLGELGSLLLPKLGELEPLLMLDEPLLLLDLQWGAHGRGSKAESVTTDDQGHQGGSQPARSNMQNEKASHVHGMPAGRVGRHREGPRATSNSWVHAKSQAVRLLRCLDAS